MYINVDNHLIQNGLRAIIQIFLWKNIIGFLDLLIYFISTLEIWTAINSILYFVDENASCLIIDVLSIIRIFSKFNRK